MCANCEYLVNPQTCGNQGYIKWNGSGTLPNPSDEYCCDLYEPGKSTGNAQMMVKALKS